MGLRQASRELRHAAAVRECVDWTLDTKRNFVLLGARREFAEPGAVVASPQLGAVTSVRTARCLSSIEEKGDIGLQEQQQMSSNRAFDERSEQAK